MPDLRSRVHGYLLGGAVGDALGAPVEFLSHQAIVARFGPDGPADFAPAYDTTGAVTDDTQVTLWTAFGASLGEESLPARWVEAVELRDLTRRIADDLHDAWAGERGWRDRYPPV